MNGICATRGTPACSSSTVKAPAVCTTPVFSKAGNHFLAHQKVVAALHRHCSHDSASRTHVHLPSLQKVWPSTPCMEPAHTHPAAAPKMSTSPVQHQPYAQPLCSSSHPRMDVAHRHIKQEDCLHVRKLQHGIANLRQYPFHFLHAVPARHPAPKLHLRWLL